MGAGENGGGGAAILEALAAEDPDQADLLKDLLKLGPEKKAFGRIELPALRAFEVKTELIGVANTGLIFEPFSKKAKTQIEEKQKGGIRLAKSKRAPRDPDAEYKQSFYGWEGDHPIFPSRTIRKGLAEVNYALGGFSYLHTYCGVQAVHPWMTILGDEPHRREDMVKLAGKGRPADVRYRAEVLNWRTTYTARVIESLITPETYLTGLRYLGLCGGLGGWRISKGGESGGFTIGQSSITPIQI